MDKADKALAPEPRVINWRAPILGGDGEQIVQMGPNGDKIAWTLKLVCERAVNAVLPDEKVTHKESYQRGALAVGIADESISNLTEDEIRLIEDCVVKATFAPIFSYRVSNLLAQADIAGVRRQAKLN